MHYFLILLLKMLIRVHISLLRAHYCSEMLIQRANLLFYLILGLRPQTVRPAAGFYPCGGLHIRAVVTAQRVIRVATFSFYVPQLNPAYIFVGT